MEQTYKGRCFCGAVQFSVTGEPALMAYCHCDSCRHWSAGPVNAFTLWSPDSFKVTQGEDNIGAFDKTAATSNETGVSNRKWCKTCGGHVFIDHPGIGLVDISAALLEGFAFNPAFHVHYSGKCPSHAGRAAQVQGSPRSRRRLRRGTPGVAKEVCFPRAFFE